ncbi:MAG: hypothetical protein IKB86_04595 [Clostridia bacterium]|nr:hypothetical protein [Clostridia bacterium]
MKKVFALLVCLLLAFTCACTPENQPGEPKENLKFGLGVYAYVSDAKNATEETDGAVKTSVCVAAVSLNKDGKVVDCAVDAIDVELKFKNDGKAIAPTETSTKYELGTKYGMTAFGAKKEWFEQADAFVSMCKGNSLEEIKAEAAKQDTNDFISAGCTIDVSDFIFALEKAVANAKDSTATADDVVKLGVVTEPLTTKDATSEKAGENGMDITVAAVAKNKDGKVTAMSVDTVEVKATFDEKGETTVEKGKKLTSKYALGAKYGMTAYGAKKEWFEQADVFSAACVGKTAAEIAATQGSDGKAISEIQTAGCTITVSAFVASAVKAAN